MAVFFQQLKPSNSSAVEDIQTPLSLDGYVSIDLTFFYLFRFVFKMIETLFFFIDRYYKVTVVQF